MRCPKNKVCPKQLANSTALDGVPDSKICRCCEGRYPDKGSGKRKKLPESKKCKVCDKETEVVYNIDFKAVRICERCARQIALQEVQDVLTRSPKMEKQ